MCVCVRVDIGVLWTVCGWILAFLISAISRIHWGKILGLSWLACVSELWTWTWTWTGVGGGLVGWWVGWLAGWPVGLFFFGPRERIFVRLLPSFFSCCKVDCNCWISEFWFVHEELQIDVGGVGSKGRSIFWIGKDV